jgi:hypothetical protein
MRWEIDSRVADLPQRRAKASGSVVRDAPHLQVMRTRKCPRASSSFLMCGRFPIDVNGGAAPDAESIQYWGLNGPVSVEGLQVMPSGLASARESAPRGFVGCLGYFKSPLVFHAPPSVPLTQKHISIYKLSMGKTKRHQQLILLDHEKALLLAKLSKESRVPRQEYLREAVDLLLKKYKMLPPKRKP